MCERTVSRPAASQCLPYAHRPALSSPDRGDDGPASPVLCSVTDAEVGFWIIGIGGALHMQQSSWGQYVSVGP